MPWKLWFAVGVLLIVDIILLTIWTAVDPLKRDVYNFRKEPSPDPEQDIEFQPQLEHCKSTHHSIWMGKWILSVVSIQNKELHFKGIEMNYF